MNDLNFFYIYTNSKKLKMRKNRTYYFILICCISLLILYTLVNQIKIRLITKEVDRLKAIIENEEVKGKISEIEKNKKELIQLESSLNDVKLLNNFIEKNAIIDDVLLDRITCSVPEKIFLTSITVDMYRMQVIGKTVDKLSIGNLLKNLEKIEIFDNLFISSISKQEQFFTFIINIQLKDVEFDGVNGNTEIVFSSEEAK